VQSITFTLTLVGHGQAHFVYLFWADVVPSPKSSAFIRSKSLTNGKDWTEVTAVLCEENAILKHSFISCLLKNSKGIIHHLIICGQRAAKVSIQVKSVSTTLDWVQIPYFAIILL
jgi:hypothetical protein